MLVAEAMKTWKPPAWMTRPIEEVEPVELPDRSEPSGKDRAAGDME
jgi:hypothetical protein